jgi:hypothetical protein
VLNIRSKSKRRKDENAGLKSWWKRKMRSYCAKGRISKDGFLRVPEGAPKPLDAAAVRRAFPDLCEEEAEEVIFSLYPERRKKIHLGQSVSVKAGVLVPISGRKSVLGARIVPKEIARVILDSAQRLASGSCREFVLC